MFGIDINLFVWYPVLVVVVIHAARIGVKSKKNGFKEIVWFFIIYCLITIVFYGMNGTPISCYIDGVKVFLIPVLFVFLGYGYQYKDEFITAYLYSCLFCFIVGLYLYFTAPPYYTSYMSEIQNSYDYNIVRSEEAILSTLRFSSFLTNSYGVEFLSIPAFILSIEYGIKNNNFYWKIVLFIIAFLSFISAILCQQRAGVVYLALIIVYYFFMLFRRKRKYFFVGAIAIVIIVITTFSYISDLDRFSDISELVTGRLNTSNYSGALSERTIQYTSFTRMTTLSLITGLGIGSCGQQASAAGLSSVTDGEFVKLFFELGLIGFSLFLIIIVCTVFKAFKRIDKHRPELFIIIFYLFASIGTNALSLYIYDFIFWYSIGLIWRKSI